MSPGGPALSPVARPAGTDAVRRIALIGVLAALAIAGRLAFLWAPNFALTYYVVFLAGVILGWRAGVAVALLAMTVTNLFLTGPSPFMVANALGVSVFGLAGGALRGIVLQPAPHRLDRTFRAALLLFVGLFATFLFSLSADLVGFAVAFLLTPEGATVGTAALPFVLLAGLVFNLVPAALNAVLFAVATPAVVAALRNAGHLPGREEAAASPA